MKKKLILITVFTWMLHAEQINAQWLPVDSGLTNVYINRLAVNGNTIFAGTHGSGGGIFISNNNGDTWAVANNGVTYTDEVTSFAFIGNNAFAGTYGGGIYLSTNNGSNWTAADNGLASYSVHTLAASGGNIFAGTYEGIFLSADTGNSWTKLINSPFDVMSIVISGTNIFAGTRGYGMYLSNDNGNSWTPVNNGLSCDTVWSLAVNGNSIFAGTNICNVFLSTNNGSSWSALHNSPTYVFDLAVNGNNTFAGSGGTGIFLSSDNGSTWTDANQGLTLNGKDVMTLAVCGNYIFEGSYGGGTWRRPLSDFSPCGANFSITPDTITLHHYVVMNNAFGKGPITYDWSWGDGTHDYTPYPSHTYADSGFYDICLSITDSTGCQSTYCDSSFHAMRTTNTMVYISVVNPLTTGTQVINSLTPQINIYPNPFTSQTTFVFSEEQTNTTIKITDLLGKEIRAINFVGNQLTLDKGEMRNGIYFVRITDDKKNVVNKKIVIQ